MTSFRLLLCGSIFAVLGGCAGQPGNNGARRVPGHPTLETAASLYARLDIDSKNFSAATASPQADPAAALKDAQAARDDVQDSAKRCAAIKGCDVQRFSSALERMPAPESMLAASDQSTTTPEATTTQGENSPVSESLPEIGHSITLLKGRDLSEVMTLNGPVKVALEEWLTSLRPNLMDTYENYQYLRHQMWPEYQKAGLPEALLFGIMAKESGGRVHALSRSGAAGLLQFMPATGQRFGLGVVDGFDQRFDPAMSARANAAYLNEQLAVFNNNLEFVIAAYNGGEGRVGRLAASKPDASFWDPKVYYELPPETRDYVPVVLAAAWLFLHPERYNLQFPKLDTRPGKINLQHATSLAELAVCLGQEGNLHDGWFRTLRNMNPAYDSRTVLPASTPINVPLQLVALYEKSCMSGLWMTLASDLHSAVLSTPVSVPAAVTASRGSVAKAPARAAPTSSQTYVVRRGETLSAIARKLGCRDARTLAEANHIKPNGYTDIRAGKVLQVSVCTQ